MNIIPEQRFWDKVKLDRGTGCWLWTGSKTPTGYGRLSVDGKTGYAHRFVFEWANGPIPAGTELDHLCRNRSCANPLHLEAVSHRENVLRGEGRAAKNALKNSCPAGHPYDELNTYPIPGGGRGCRACRREATRRYQTRQQEVTS